MTITNVEFSGEENGEFLGYVAVTFDHVFVVKGMKIVRRREGGLILSMPSRKRPDATHVDMAHPIDKKFREQLENRVFEALSAQRHVAA